jgi:protein-L-isoaspartate(D-aspartate) O-methyltransferase
LYCYDLDKALREVERVGKKKYIVVESYRNEEEKANLLYWQLTCEAFCTPEEWRWWFQQTGYTGDYSFIYFE